MKKTIEIPEGYEARIEGRKAIIELKESDDERIRKELLAYIKEHPAAPEGHIEQSVLSSWLAYLEKQKDEAQKQFNLGVQAGTRGTTQERRNKYMEWKELKWYKADKDYSFSYVRCLVIAKNGNVVIRDNAKKGEHYIPLPIIEDLPKD